MRTTIELPPQVRAAHFSSFNPGDNTVELVWTTGAPVRRFDWRSGQYYDEVLDVRPGSARLDRLNAGASLLDTHRANHINGIIGAVVPGSAYIAGGQGIARVKLSSRKEIAGIVLDIRDGIIRNVSVGYRVHRYEKTPAKNGKLAEWRAVDWEPVELSAVPIPADAGAQFRSRLCADLAPCVFITQPSEL